MPEKDQASWAGDYRYSVGPAFFVAPLLDGIGARSVVLPFGARYSGWWDDAAAVLEAGATVSRSYAGDPIENPLFLREGFIVPLDGDTAGAGMSDAYATTLGLPLPGRALVVLATPADTATTFALHDVTGDATLGVSRANGAITFTAEGTSRPLLVRVRQDAAPSTVIVDGAATPPVAREARGSTPGFFHDPAAPYTYICLAPGASRAVTL